MSTLLVACCYWRRANDLGAAAAIFFGALMPVAVLVLQKLGPWTAWVKQNEASCMIVVYATTAAAMIVGSYLKPQPQGSPQGDKS